MAKDEAVKVMGVMDMRSIWHNDKDNHLSFGDYMAELAIKQKKEIETLSAEVSRQSDVITKQNAQMAEDEIKHKAQVEILNDELTIPRTSEVATNGEVSIS